MLRISLEGPDENFDKIIEKEIPLRENEPIYRFLYANPSY
jgi:hypothetical protein